MGVRIAGSAGYLPGPPIDQDGVRAFLRRHPDGLSEHAQERLLAETGILTRHYAIDVTDDTRRETNTTMAVAAGRMALADAGWRAEDVDLLVVTTVVPDQLMPPTSTLIQEALGIPRCTEVEICANCSAPHKGLAFALGQLRQGLARRALLCSVQLSSVLLCPPWTNPACMRGTQGAVRWIVSDGAGALALEASERDADIRVWIQSTSVTNRSGMTLALGVAHPDLQRAFASGSHHVTQDDGYDPRAGVARAVDAVEEMLRTFGVDGAVVDHFLPAVSSMHVSRGFQRLLADRVGIRPSAWRLVLERTGYLGGVGFLVLLDEMAHARVLKPGDLICGFAEEASKWIAAGIVLRWDG